MEDFVSPGFLVANKKLSNTCAVFFFDFFVFGKKRRREGAGQIYRAYIFLKNIFKLSAMDVLARTTMKDAANCGMQCELQNSVNHKNAERKRHL